MNDRHSKPLCRALDSFHRAAPVQRREAGEPPPSMSVPSGWAKTETPTIGLAPTLPPVVTGWWSRHKVCAGLRWRKIATGGARFVRTVALGYDIGARVLIHRESVCLWWHALAKRRDLCDIGATGLERCRRHHVGPRQLSAGQLPAGRRGAAHP